MINTYYISESAVKTASARCVINSFSRIRTVVAVLLGSLSLLVQSSLVQAQGNEDSRWYVVSAIGTVAGSRSASDISNDLSNNGVTVTDLKVDDSRTGWQLNLGYELTDNFAVEVGYLDLNDVSVTLTAQVTDPELFIKQAKNIHPNSADGFTVAGIYRYSLNDKFTLSGRIGLFSWNGGFDTHSFGGERLASDDRSGHDLFYGLGGGYQMTDNLILVIEWDRFKIDSESLRMWSVGAKYKF